MSFGGRGGIRIIRRMCWWMWWLGYWRWCRLGLGFIGCRGECLFVCYSFPSHWELDYRDIPLPLVTSGCENSGNLRELALNRMKDFGAECRDVRYREVGGEPNNIPSAYFVVTYSFVLHRYTKSTTKSDPNPSSSSDATTQRTAAGRRSSHTKTQKQISSSDSYVYGNVQKRERSVLNW